MSKKFLQLPVQTAKEPHSPTEAFISFSCQKCRKHLAVTKCSGELNASTDSLSQDENAWMKVSPFRSTGSSLPFNWIAHTNELLAFVSEVTQQDQPLCFECTEFMVSDLESRLRNCETDQNCYHGILLDLESEERVACSGNEVQLLQELSELESEEGRMKQELGLLEAELKDLEREEDLTNRQQDELDAQVEEHWKTYNACLVETAEVCEKKMALDQHLAMEMEELTQLNRTNILNEAFHIWFDGHFGTINNFRLGKTLSEPVEWNEINAAWGHAALLLHTIARLRKIQFTKYTVVPMGSFSTVEPGRYELYGGAPVFWASSRFDKAMVGFLWCLNDVLQKERLNTQESIPYEVQDDKIGGLTIKLVSNEPEKWTRALKFVLTDLKWLVVLISKDPPHAASL